MGLLFISFAHKEQNVVWTMGDCVDELFGDIVCVLIIVYNKRATSSQSSHTFFQAPQQEHGFKVDFWSRLPIIS